MKGWRRKYREYIKSPDWKAKRAEAISHYGARCLRCGAEDKPLHVHHLSYERLGDELLDDLQVLCKPCHKKEHAADRRERRKRAKATRGMKVYFDPSRIKVKQ